jgi:hypothetical protein
MPLLVAALGLAACGGPSHPGAGPAPLDLTVPLPAPASAGLTTGSGFMGCDPVDAVWSDASTEVAVLCEGGRLRAWHVPSGRVLHAEGGVERQTQIHIDTAGQTLAIDDRTIIRLVDLMRPRELGRWRGQLLAPPTFGTLAVDLIEHPDRPSPGVVVRDGRTGRETIHPATVPGGASGHDSVQAPTGLLDDFRVATFDGRVVALSWRARGMQVIDLDRGRERWFAGGHGPAFAPPRWIAWRTGANLSLLDASRPDDAPVALTDPRCAGTTLRHGSSTEPLIAVATDNRTVCMVDAPRAAFRWVVELPGKLPSPEDHLEDAGLFCLLRWRAEGRVIDAAGCGAEGAEIEVASGKLEGAAAILQSVVDSDGDHVRRGGAPIMALGQEESAWVAPDGRTVLIAGSRKAARIVDVATQESRELP